MRLSLNWIGDFIKIDKSPEEIAEKITLSLSEVERIEKVGEDTVLEIENKALTHRPDCFSQLGLASELAALFRLKLDDPLEKLNNSQLVPSEKIFPLTVKIQNQDLCRRYTTIVVSEIKVGPSPAFIKERLAACNVRSINNVVDITNYVMLALGQPLHAFDYQKIKGNSIIVRTALDNEEIITLDQVKRKLDQRILVIADNEKAVAAAGIMGASNSYIDQTTETVILESANFEAKSIRKGSKKLNLRTEASLRFEKNLDPFLTKPALVYAVFLLQKYAGAKIASKIIDVYPKKEATKKIVTSTNYINKILGLNLKEGEIIEMLNRLGIKAQSKNQELVVTPPPLRRDLKIGADVAEEVTRIYGYDNIPTTLPKGIITPPPVNLSLYWEKRTKLFLIGLGLNEVNLSSFLGKEILELVDEPPSRFLKLINPLSSEKTYLRRSLLPGLLSACKANLRFFSKFDLFEIGRVFLKNNQNQQPNEIKMLSSIMIDKSFYEAKGIIEALFDFWKIPLPQFDYYNETKIFLPKASARLADFGVLGEVNLNIKNYLGTQVKVTAFEINFDKVVKLARKENFYQPIPLFPPLIEDFSFVFRKKPILGPIISALKAISRLISEVTVIDRFGKNITFRIAFQDPFKSLSSEEIKPIRKKIIDELESNFAAEFKKQE